jgi:hypothetical protein
MANDESNDEPTDVDGGLEIEDLPPAFAGEVRAINQTAKVTQELIDSGHFTVNYNKDQFPVPGRHYEVPQAARNEAERLGLDPTSHVALVEGNKRYVPGNNMAALRNAIDEKPKTNLETSEFARYDAGEKVMLNREDEVGTIVELHTDTFEFGGQSFNATQDMPLYVVAAESVTCIVQNAKLEQEDWSADEPGVDPTPEALAEGGEMKNNYDDVSDPTMDNPFPERTVNDVARQFSAAEIDATGIGFNSYPESWRESDRPTRLILLDAWTSMGASFTGCRREMESTKFCAAMKDEIYGTTEWR